MIKMHKWVVIISVSLISSWIGACKTTDSSEWLKVGQNVYGQVSGKPLTQQEIAAGLKQALEVGTNNVVAQLGKRNGFYRDSSIHIPLPDSLAKVQRTLKKVGLSSYLDELELSLNRAAEQAVPKARKLFWQAIEEMSWDDVMKIYKGPDDAATHYFRNKMTPALTRDMYPVVQKTLASAGVIKAYDRVMKEYYAIPYVPTIKADLNDYVIQQSLAGMFYYLAKEEAAIRKDPLKRTTELLKRVFGSR